MLVCCLHPLNFPQRSCTSFFRGKLLHSSEAVYHKWHWSRDRFSRALPLGWARTMLFVHHTNLHKGAFDDRVTSFCICHLHCDHRCPNLTCSCSTKIKSDSGRTRRTIQDPSMLSVPTYEEWLPHVLRLNSVTPCNWPTSDFLLGHNEAEISFDRSFRMPVTVFKDSSGSDPFIKERWLDLLQ